MKTVIVYNHPNDGSFCNAILQAVLSGLTNSGNDADLLHPDKVGFIISYLIMR